MKKPTLGDLFIQKDLITDVTNDIETMGTKSNAIICSIGSSSWNKHTGIINNNFHVTIDWKQALLDYPNLFSTSDSTILFWEKQNEIARLELKGTTSLKDALSLFIEWWENNCNDDTKVWGNGVEFDLTIMEHAFEVCNLVAPWNFRNKEHMRTIVNIGREYLGINPKENLPFIGELHVSIDDATHEAKVIMMIQQELASKLLTL